MIRVAGIAAAGTGGLVAIGIVVDSGWLMFLGALANLIVGVLLLVNASRDLPDAKQVVLRLGSLGTIVFGSASLIAAITWGFMGTAKYRVEEPWLKALQLATAMIVVQAIVWAVSTSILVLTLKRRSRLSI